ncbi:hypothetical protein H0H93_004658 [Arthromyces matolae]|nr:hypothetical protein H0H93_004658 [Arthromyces matolae]
MPADRTKKHRKNRHSPPSSVADLEQIQEELFSGALFTRDLKREFHDNPMKNMPQTLEEYLKQRKWGCTCGKCLDGWLSCRMRKRIVYAARKLSRPAIRRQDSVSPYWAGYIGMLSTIARVADSDLYFDQETILAQSKGDDADPRVTVYLDGGGQVSKMLEVVMEMAWEQSLCDLADPLEEEDEEEEMKYLGYMNADDDDDDESDSASENKGDDDDDDEVVDALPLNLCDNDENFRMVRRRLGLPPDLVHDPYERPGCR